MSKRLLTMALLATSSIFVSCGPSQKAGALPVAEVPPPPTPTQPQPAAPPPPAAKAATQPLLVPAPLANDATRTTIHRLSNGMTVYLSPDPQEPSVVAHIAVHAGSSYDPELSTGLAHYLEHMLFKGTTKLGTLDYAQERPHLDKIAELYRALRAPNAKRDEILQAIDRETQAAAAFSVPNELDQLYARLGVAGLNAYTNNDATVYVAKVPKNRLAAWARVEAQRYRDPVFRLFWPELEAVYEEKNRGLDNPARRVRDAFMRAMFPKHGYGWSSTLGEVEHLKNPAYQDMLDFFQRYYTPSNMAILLSGDVDESVLPLLEQELGSFQRDAGPAAAPGAIAPLAGRTQIDVTVPATEGVLMGWRLVPATHADRIALEVMDRLMLDGASGLLQRDLLLPQKVSTAGSRPTFMRDAGFFQLYADALAGQSHAELERLLLDEVAKLKRGEVTDAEVAAAALTADIEHQRAIESNGGRMNVLEDAFINDEDWRDVVQRVERMRQVTKADVVRVAQRYLTDAFLIVRKVKGQVQTPKITKPGITPIKIDATRSSPYAKAILEMPSTPIAPVAIAAGRDYALQTTKAGPLIAVANPRNELFAIRYDYDVGRRDDKLICLALEVLRKAGAGDRSADQLATELHALGAAVSSTCTRNDTSIVISGIDRNMDATMALVRTWLAQATFDDAAIKARVAAVKTERGNALSNPQIIAAAMQDYARYNGDTEYLITPSNAQLDAATPKQLKVLLDNFLHWRHRTSYFGPRPADAKLAPLVALGDGARSTTPRKRLALRPPNTTLIADQPTAQTHIWLTWPRAATRADERALGTVFAGYIAPRLYQEVREARGLAYTTYGGYGASPKLADDATLFAYVGTQGDKAHDALDAVLETLRAPVDAERFALAKDRLAEAYRVDRVAPRELAALVYRWQDQGERTDPRADRAARVAKVDLGALDRWRKAAFGRPVIVSVTGDHRKLDDARLGALAPIAIVPVSKLFGY